MAKLKKTLKETLIEKLLNDMRSDVCNYEDMLFDLAEETLKKCSIRELKNLLGLEE